MRYFSWFVSGDLTCVLLKISSLCLIVRSFIFNTHGFVRGGGGPDHQSVPITVLLQSDSFINDLAPHSDDVHVPLPQHHEPLQLIHIAGQPDGVALVDQQDLRVCLELWCCGDPDLIVIVRLQITVIIVLVVLGHLILTVRRSCKQ